MNWRERLADAISGGALTRARALTMEAWADNGAKNLAVEYTARRADEITAQAQLYRHFLRSILTARNITEARKIARQALGEAE